MDAKVVDIDCAVCVIGGCKLQSRSARTGRSQVPKNGWAVQREWAADQLAIRTAGVDVELARRVDRKKVTCGVELQAAGSGILVAGCGDPCSSAAREIRERRIT